MNFQQNFNQNEFVRISRIRRNWPRLFAEGDSWFAYPPVLESNILRHLGNRKRRCILSRASNGAEALGMLGVKQRGRLVRDLERFRFDAILFSAGGNDFAGDELIHFLRPWKSGMPAREALHDAAVVGRLALVRRCYEELLEIRDRLQPGVPVITHEYAIPFPDGREAARKLGPWKVGPWLEPSLDAREYPRDLRKRRAVIRELMVRFRAEIRSIDAEDFVVVPSQSLPIPHKGWDNELHPKSRYFKKIADMMAEHIPAQHGGED